MGRLKESRTGEFRVRKCAPVIVLMAIFWTASIFGQLEVETKGLQAAEAYRRIDLMYILYIEILDFNGIGQFLLSIG